MRWVTGAKPLQVQPTLLLIDHQVGMMHPHAACRGRADRDQHTDRRTGSGLINARWSATDPTTFQRRLPGVRRWDRIKTNKEN